MDFDGLYYEILKEDVDESEADELIRSFEQGFCGFAEEHGLIPVRKTPPLSYDRMGVRD